MQYIPKTLSLMEVIVPDVYHERVMGIFDALESGKIAEALSTRPHLNNFGVRNTINDLIRALAGSEGQAAQAYDILYLTLLVKEVEHDRDVVASADVKSGKFEHELISLVDRVRVAPVPTYLNGKLVTR